MKLRNILIVVEDIEKATQFYHDVFGLTVVLRGEGNVILTEGLVLQKRSIWQEAIGCPTLPENNASVLYFEEQEIEPFLEKLERLYPNIRYVSPLTTNGWGRKMVRFYDPDGNLIEVGTPVIG